MTAVEFTTALERLGFSQRGFAKLIRSDARTVRRWVAGDAPVPGLVTVFLELLVLLEVDADRAWQLIGGKDG